MKLVIGMKHIRNSDLKPQARSLRKNATKQENHFWYDYLKVYPVPFRRQVQFSLFIVDFFCSKANLILEIDGSQHYTEQGVAYDAERSAILQAFGYRVLRFSNHDVDHHFDAVCKAIDLAVKEGLAARERRKANITKKGI